MYRPADSSVLQEGGFKCLGVDNKTQVRDQGDDDKWKDVQTFRDTRTKRTLREIQYGALTWSKSSGKEDVGRIHNWGGIQIDRNESRLHGDPILSRALSCPERPLAQM